MARRAATPATPTSWRSARRSRWRAPCPTSLTCSWAVPPHNWRTLPTRKHTCTCDQVRSAYQTRVDVDNTFDLPDGADQFGCDGAGACLAGDRDAARGPRPARPGLSALGTWVHRGWAGSRAAREVPN